MPLHDHVIVPLLKLQYTCESWIDKKTRGMIDQLIRQFLERINITIDNCADLKNDTDIMSIKINIIS